MSDPTRNQPGDHLHHHQDHHHQDHQHQNHQYQHLPHQHHPYVFSDLHNHDRGHQYASQQQMGYQPSSSELWAQYHRLSRFDASEARNVTPNSNYAYPTDAFHGQGDIFAVRPNLDNIYKFQNFAPENSYSNRNGVYTVNSRPNATALLDNVLGNWAPNTSGTYSPFGNAVTTANLNSLFDSPKSGNINEDSKISHLSSKSPIEESHFQFGNRDSKKPRIVAEVKPMRPTYSDVLAKSAPNTGNNKSSMKIDQQKEIKMKKDSNKKNPKVEKSSQKSNVLNRSNTSNEIKDIPDNKIVYHNNKSYEKTKDVATTTTTTSKSNQLNRKWVSLDDVSESFIITQESKEKKIDDAVNKQSQKGSSVQRKPSVNNSAVNNNKSSSEQNDTDSGSHNTKNESYFVSNRSTVKKNTKASMKQQKGMTGSPVNSDYPSQNIGGSRRGPRRKKDNQLPFDLYRQKLVVYLKNWWKFLVGFVLWLFTLVSDICSLSWQISRDSMSYMWTWSVTHWAAVKETLVYLIRRVRFFTWLYEKFKKPKEKDDKQQQQRSFARAGLQYNISMPQTGEEAMKRLLACKGKDPYSILGVTPACTDDDIKRYYKKQAVLVHPDKNKQPGAEEAFKILVHAFDMISEPERRAAYDRGVAESAQVEQAWTELTELLAQFQQKVEAAAKTIRCSYCGSGHKRTKVERPTYAARNCNTCRIFHAAREGDIWAEAACLGLLWNYYACMDGGVYDITDWASCQKNSLKQLRPDSHNVQYRIALGKSQAAAPSGGGLGNGATTSTSAGASSCKRHSPTSGSRRSEGDDASNLESLLNKYYGQAAEAGPNGRRKNGRKRFK